MRLHAAVREILNREDPIGLIGIGAPADEYDPELREILPKVKECKSVESLVTMIHAVFVKWFDKETAGAREISFYCSKSVRVEENAVKKVRQHGRETRRHV